MFEKNKLPFTEADILARGRQDGSNNLPAPDQAGIASFEEELLRAHEVGASQVVERCLRELENLDGSIDSHRSLTLDGYQTDIQHCEAEHQAELARTNDDPILKHVTEDYEEAARVFKNLYARHNRMPVSYLPHWLYLVLAIAIGIGEVPLNALVFNIFGENQVMTWIMSFIIGLTIPITSHFIGIKIREHGEGFSFPNAIKAAIVAAIIVGALYSLSIMRQRYLGDISQDIGLSAKLVETSFLFFWLNIAVFAAAILIAYLSHDSIPGYERSCQEKNRAQKRLRQLQERQARTLDDIAKRNSRCLREAAEKRLEAEKQVHLLQGEYDSRLKASQQQEAQWLHRLGQAVSRYRGENLRNRTDKKEPPCFSNKVEFPLRLAGLPEKTTNHAPE